MRGFLKCGWILVWIFLAAPVSVKTLTGTVVSVSEGDILTVQTLGGRYFKVRLADIDCPQLKQLFGNQAKKFTEDLVLRKEVLVGYEWADIYGRIIGKAYLADGRELNVELVRGGYAWHYRIQSPENETLAQLEAEARRKKLGLWVDSAPVAPWLFRRENPVPDPPGTRDQEDYDRILNYGLIGNPQTKIFLWPACRNYPEQIDSYVIFGNILEAEAHGYKMSRQCPRR